MHLLQGDIDDWIEDLYDVQSHLVLFSHPIYWIIYLAFEPSAEVFFFFHSFRIPLNLSSLSENIFIINEGIIYSKEENTVLVYQVPS